MAQNESSRSHAPASASSSQMINAMMQGFGVLKNQLMTNQSVSGKHHFDGTSGEHFTKWLAEMDNLHMALKGDEEQTLWAASQTLKGTALDYFHEVSPSIDSWARFKTLMTQRYHYLDDADTAKQKLQNFVQRPNESIPHYAERLQALSRQAYKEKIDESSVVEAITRTFINGIIDRKLQERIATRRPKSPTEAYHIAMDQIKLMTELATYRDHSKGKPEPMDCNAVTPAPEPPAQNSDLSEVRDLLEVLVRRSDDSFKVRPQVHQSYQQPSAYQSYPPPVNQPPPGQFFQRQPTQPGQQRQNPGNFRQNSRPKPVYQWTSDHRPICYYCGLIGHVQRICLKRQAANNSTQRPQNQQQGRPNRGQSQPGNM